MVLVFLTESPTWFAQKYLKRPFCLQVRSRCGSAPEKCDKVDKVFDKVDFLVWKKDAVFETENELLLSQKTHDI